MCVCNLIQFNCLINVVDLTLFSHITLYALHDLRLYDRGGRISRQDK